MKSLRKKSANRLMNWLFGTKGLSVFGAFAPWNLGVLTLQWLPVVMLSGNVDKKPIYRAIPVLEI